MDSLDELKLKIDKFNKARDWDQFHSPANLAKSIVIEAAELLECFQWNDEYNLDDVKDELADVINYCIQMSMVLDLDIKKIVNDKMLKNAKNTLFLNLRARLINMISLCLMKKKS